MNYIKKTRKLEKEFSPDFVKFIDDTYEYLSKYSGKKFAESLGISRSTLDFRKNKKEKKS